MREVQAGNAERAGYGEKVTRYGATAQAIAEDERNRQRRERGIAGAASFTAEECRYAL